jgi:hypothetical protein
MNERGVYRELIQGWMRDVDRYHKVWRWVHAQIQRTLAAHRRLVLDVKAGVGLKAPLEILPLECR